MRYIHRKLDWCVPEGIRDDSVGVVMGGAYVLYIQLKKLVGNWSRSFSLRSHTLSTHQGHILQKYRKGEGL